MRVLVVVFVSLLILAHANVGRAQSPNVDAFPTTVEEVVRDIISRLSTADRELVKTTRRQDLIKFHHGWGTSIRNHYGLWGSNTKLLQAACGKPCHPDDASMIIIEAVWQALQK